MNKGRGTSRPVARPNRRRKPWCFASIGSYTSHYSESVDVNEVGLLKLTVSVLRAPTRDAILLFDLFTHLDVSQQAGLAQPVDPL
jgi:hypothetical protein